MPGKTLAAAASTVEDVRGDLTTAATSPRPSVSARRSPSGQGGGITKVAFDRGGRKYHGRVKALADAAREGGLQF